MRTIHLSWRQQSDHSATVNVPEAFDLEAVPYAILRNLVAGLPDADTYDNGFEYAFAFKNAAEFDPAADLLFEKA